MAKATYTDQELAPYLSSLSDADKQLSQEGQRYIAQQKYDWANGDAAQKAQANRNAEERRWSEGGYYAGKSGDQYITPNSVYMSSADRNFMNADERNQVANWKAQEKAGYLSTGEANKLAEAVRKNYNYSGGKYGDEYLPFKLADGQDTFSYQGLPESVSRYDQMIQDLSSRLLNQGGFSYDPNSDPLYKLYAQQYTAGGQSAMQNTLAQIAARTGGLASSYAGTAAQNAYNGYMTQLANKIPELYQMAYGMYRDRQADMRDNMAMLQSLSNSGYDRYANERNFAYQNYTGNRDYNHQINRDMNDDYRYEADRADAQLDRDMARRELAADVLMNIASGGAGAAADGVDFQTYLAQGLANMGTPELMQLLGLNV